MLVAAAREEEGIHVHIVVVSDGRMGYADPTEKEAIVETRQQELIRALSQLEITSDHVHLGFPMELWSCTKGAIPRERVSAKAHRHASKKSKPAWFLDPPHGIFIPTTGLPAGNWIWLAAGQGSDIWREMGPVLSPVKRFNYAVYCAFPEPRISNQKRPRTL